jgi:hypothetical protein
MILLNFAIPGNISAFSQDAPDSFIDPLVPFA